MMERAQAANLLKALSGDAPGVFISFELIKKVGDLQTAAFISQATWLSVNATNDGWFFLDQKGAGVTIKEGIYKTLGSWQQGLGISEHAQKEIRALMVKKGWLCELPSASGSRRGEKAKGNEDTAFFFTQRQGTPPRLHYHVDLPRYLKFLADCAQVVDSKHSLENTDLKPRIHELETVDSRIQNHQIPGFVYKTEAETKSADIITTTTPNPSSKTKPEVGDGGGGGGGGEDFEELIDAACWEQAQVEPIKNRTRFRSSLRTRMNEHVSQDDLETLKRYRRFLDAQAQQEKIRLEAAQQAATKPILEGEAARKRASEILATSRIAKWEAEKQLRGVALAFRSPSD